MIIIRLFLMMNLRNGVIKMKVMIFRIFVEIKLDNFVLVIVVLINLLISVCDEDDGML